MFTDGSSVEVGRVAGYGIYAHPDVSIAAQRSWQAPPPAWSVQYIRVLRPHWALPLWRTASPASNPVAKLTLLYIPLGHCCLSTLSVLMAELTSVGTKKKLLHKCQ